MELPLVSAIIPFYSNKGWLVEAIDSVIAQTYENIEIIVINDGSPEKIDDVIEKYKSKIRVIHKQNGGPSTARNLGIKESTGKYVAFLDSDDIWLPKKVEKQIKYMEENNYVWSQHSYKMFWEGRDKSKIINTSKHVNNVFKDCLISFKVQTSTVIILKDILIDNNIVFPVNKRYGQDISYFREIAETYPLGYVDGVHSLFRIRGSNAGFKVRIQLNYRAETYLEIKDAQNTLDKLPVMVMLSYKMCDYFNNKLSRLVNNFSIKSERVIENLSRILYVVPYTIFKIYSK